MLNPLTYRNRMFKIKKEDIFVYLLVQYNNNNNRNFNSICSELITTYKNMASNLTLKYLKHNNIIIINIGKIEIYYIMYWIIENGIR